MGYIKLKDRLPNLEDYLIGKYGSKEKFANLDDYKFICLLCTKVPDLEVSDGFPYFLLADTWEVTYEVLANFDIKNNDLIDKTIDFFEILATDIDLQWYLNDFFETFCGDMDKFESFVPKFKQETQKLWDKYIINCK